MKKKNAAHNERNVAATKEANIAQEQGLQGDFPKRTRANSNRVSQLPSNARYLVKSGNPPAQLRYFRFWAVTYRSRQRHRKQFYRYGVVAH